MGAQHAAFVTQDQAKELLARAGRGQCRLAGEAALALQVDGPGQAGVQRRGADVHVLAVQVHAGLQAQRVARAQAGRAHARGIQFFPQAGDAGGRHDQLETVFAGVAGARDHHLAQGGVLHHDSVERLERIGRLGRGERAPHLGAGVGALHRDDRQRLHARGRDVFAARGDGHAAAGGVIARADPVDIAGRGAGVDHQAETVLGKEVDDQVVDHAAFLVQHA
ncbi:hypothetical protein D9M72_482920 [compost metagenome]